MFASKFAQDHLRTQYLASHLYVHGMLSHSLTFHRLAMVDKNVQQLPFRAIAKVYRSTPGLLPRSLHSIVIVGKENKLKLAQIALHIYLGPNRRRRRRRNGGQPAVLSGPIRKRNLIRC